MRPLAPDPDKLGVKVFINDEEVVVRLAQKMVEYFGEGETGNSSCFLSIDRKNLPPCPTTYSESG